MKTSDSFRKVRDSLEWVQNKQIEVENTGYGNDLDSTRDALDFHQVIHQEVLDFDQHFRQCVDAQKNFHGDELEVYRDFLSKLEMAYSNLKVNMLWTTVSVLVTFVD